MRIETSKIKVLDGQNRDNSDKSIIQSVEKEGVLVPNARKTLQLTMFFLKVLTEAAQTANVIVGRYPD